MASAVDVLNSLNHCGHNMETLLPLFIQQLINGLSLGAIYALIAIGYTMVYGIVGMINFAHGEIYMIGAYIGLVLITLLAGSGLSPVSILFLSLMISILWTALYGFSVERIAYRPLRIRRSPRLVPLITAIGVSIFLTNYVQLGQGSRDIAFPQLLPGSFNFDITGFVVTLSYTRLLIIGMSVCLMLALTVFIARSRIGKACRACAQDMQMANLLGIDTHKIVAITFVLGAMLAAVGGVLIGLSVGKITPYIGFTAGIKAFTAAVLGGIGSLPGAMLGGVILGLTETFASALLPTEYKDIVAFGLLMLILLFKPTGLLGKPDIEKV